MMGELKLGVQMYSLRSVTGTRESSIEGLRKVAAMGYRAIQFQPGCPELPFEETGALARELGMEVCATHVDFEWIRDRPAEVIEAHRAIGCGIAGIGWMPEEYARDAKGFSAFARDCNPSARALAKAGIRLVYHNHHHEFRKMDGRLGMGILIEELDPVVGFELDTYWVQAGGADPAAWIDALRGRVPVVHLKDMALDESNGQVFAEVGEGNLNWPGILAACRRSGAEWAVVEQDLCLGSPFDCVERSLRNLRAMGLG
jgi:sugar phosphate isomerase/epimerase